jgi:fatty acid desaturase
MLEIVRKSAPLLRVEWPTVLLGLAIYGLWLLVTANHHVLPLWVTSPVGAWLVAWHGSLQHEAVHRHPFAHRLSNVAFASLPLSLYLPFTLYRRSHLAHHGVRRLTDPARDPESFYVDAETWSRASPLNRGLLRAESTLAGRMVLGPFRVVARVVAGELARLRHEPGDVARVWSLHAAWVAPVIYWIVFVCQIPLLDYAAFYVYPGLSLTLLRSFIEHRADGEPAERSVIVEAEPPLAWLFLNNNLHALHHEEPSLPWYALPARYRERGAELRETNGQYVFAGYRAVARLFLLTPKDSPLHPEHR